MTTAKLAPGSVTTPKIRAGAVTAAKLRPGERYLLGGVDLLGGQRCEIGLDQQADYVLPGVDRLGRLRRGPLRLSQQRRRLT